MSNGNIDETFIEVVDQFSGQAVIGIVAEGPPGQDGKDGERGEPGIGTVTSTPISSPVDIFHALVIAPDGTLKMADPTNEDDLGRVLGIAIQSVTVPGQPVNVQQAGIVIGFAGLIPGADYFVGSTGYPSVDQTFPGAVWQQYLGTALSDTELMLTIGTAIHT